MQWKTIFPKIMNRLIKVLKRKTNALDLGCGTGTSSFYFAKKGFAVTGVDISTTAIEMAQSLAHQQNLQIDFKVADVLDLGALHQKFDFIYDSHCLHCIVFDEDRRRVLSGIKSILSENGVFVLDTMVFSETMDLSVEESDFLRFDDNYILWHRSKDLSIRGIVEHEGQYWCAQRRIRPAHDVLDEIRNSGFEVICQKIDHQSGKEPTMLRLVLK